VNEPAGVYKTVQGCRVLTNVKGSIYAALLAIASFLGGPIAQGGGDGLLGLWAFLMCGSLVSLIALFANMRPANSHPQT